MFFTWRIWVCGVVLAGCGNVSKTSTDANSGAADASAADASAADASDCLPSGAQTPSLVSSTPENGATKVVDDPVTLTFSVPMDRATVEAAFPGAANFSWNEAGEVVEFDYPFDFGEEAKAATLTIPASVRDAECNEIGEEIDIVVTLAALKRVELLFDASLTGNVSDGSDSPGTWAYAGDNSADGIRFAGVTFALAVLPDYAGVVSVRSAHLRGQVSRVSGDPNNAALDGWTLEHVNYVSLATIDTAEVVAMLGSPFAGAIALGDTFEIDVLELFTTGWIDEADNLQFRLYPNGVNADATSDVIFIRRKEDEENTSVVDESLPLADAENNVRIDVEYFE